MCIEADGLRAEGQQERHEVVGAAGLQPPANGLTAVFNAAYWMLSKVGLEEK